MKKLILALGFLLSAAASADYTVTWVPGPAVEGAPVDAFLLWCIPVDRTYGAPNVLPADARSYTQEWPGPAGDWKCKMRSRSGDVESADSEEVFFTLADLDGDGNNEVAGDDPPPIDIPPPSAPRVMTITRKGYYTITGPDNALLLKPDGSTRQVTSRDEAFEYTSQDGRLGVFTINQPPIEVEWKI